MAFSLEGAGPGLMNTAATWTDDRQEATHDLVLTLIFKYTIPAKRGGPVSVLESVSYHYFFLGYSVRGRMGLLRREYFLFLKPKLCD